MPLPSRPRFESMFGPPRTAGPAIALLLALAACGGGGLETDGAALMPTQAKPVQTTAAQPDSAAIATLPAPLPKASLPAANPTTDETVESVAYDLRLYDRGGQVLTAVELRPTQGRGYETVRVHVVLQGRRVISPVAQVQARCPTPTRCEYLPSRRDEGAARFMVSIADDTIARLSPAKDLIAVTVRDLNVDRTVEVTVRLTVDGKPAGERKIRYLRADT